ncbi:MAG: HNH endonuclease [Myxococcales bacterium]
MSNGDLLDATRALAQRACEVEADLIVHLAEIDERKLYLQSAFPSMFAFCVGELGFSEDAAYSRILVARAARRLPAVIDPLRSRRVHLTGLRLLVPHLTLENSQEAVARAAGKSKREVEELVAHLAPQPPVPPAVRKLPAPATAPEPPSVPPSAVASALPPRPVVRPLAENSYRIQFTASDLFRNKLRRAQDLLRHRVPDGDLAAIFERALDVLIERVEKERFASGCKPSTDVAAKQSKSRYVPAAIRRKVYERDGGRCTFVDASGRRCWETGFLELDHTDGFARTHTHDADSMRLLCGDHTQHAAELLYG